MSTFGPITTLFKLGQLLNAFLLRSSFVLSSNCMLRRLSQQLKAQDLIEVVVRGILYSFIPQGKDINSVFDALYSAVPSEEKFSFPSSTDMDSSELQPENTLDSTVLREAGNVMAFNEEHDMYLQPIITQYFIDNKSEIWLLFLIAHSKR
jgi:hypothetical protein